MELSFDTFGKEYRVALHGALTHDVRLGSDIFGNITRIDNKLGSLAESLKKCEAQLATVQTQLITAKVEVDRHFPQEQEYAEKSTRLKELNILLNMDQKDHGILDMEPDEGDVGPPQRVTGREAVMCSTDNSQADRHLLTKYYKLHGWRYAKLRHPYQPISLPGNGFGYGFIAGKTGCYLDKCTNQV
jgi:hypothetical protein